MVPSAVLGRTCGQGGKRRVRKHGVNEECMLIAGSGVTTVCFLHMHGMQERCQARPELSDRKPKEPSNRQRLEISALAVVIEWTTHC